LIRAAFGCSAQSYCPTGFGILGRDGKAREALKSYNAHLAPLNGPSTVASFVRHYEAAQGRDAGAVNAIKTGDIADLNDRSPPMVAESASPVRRPLSRTASLVGIDRNGAKLP
jgi:hypothetical protein